MQNILALYAFASRQIEVALHCYATVVVFSSDVFALHIVRVHTHYNSFEMAKSRVLYTTIIYARFRRS